jgi:hypothetical protein
MTTHPPICDASASNLGVCKRQACRYVAAVQEQRPEGTLMQENSQDWTTSASSRTNMNCSGTDPLVV